MRDLNNEELVHVYGAGGYGKKSCGKKDKHGRRGGGSGSGSGGRGNSSGSGGRKCKHHGRRGGSSS